MTLKAEDPLRIIVNIAQQNVEGLTRAKADILSKMFADVDVLAIKETHVPDGETNHLKINGFDLLNHADHNKHGLATYINQNWSFTNVERVAGNEYAIGVRIGNLTIFNVYKPPLCNWTAPVYLFANTQVST